MSTQRQMSPRIQDLRDDLVNRMPIQKAQDQAKLANEHITTVLIHYLTWQARLIRPRPRSVIIWPQVFSSPHYLTHQADIERLKNEFEIGIDLNAALSNQVRRNVYAGDLPTNTANMSNEEWVNKAWKGKDRIRVLVNAHHLHLGARQPDGMVARTDPLLFAGIAPQHVFFLTIGDHSSFDDGSISKIMWDALDAQATVDSGGAYLSPGEGVTLGGTQVADTLAAITIVKKLEAIDRQLDQHGNADMSIRFDWDDIVLQDSHGNEVERIAGRF
ncbi:hypothetical protein ACVDG9_18385 [Roseibium sp. RP-7]